MAFYCSINAWYCSKANDHKQINRGHFEETMSESFMTINKYIDCVDFQMHSHSLKKIIYSIYIHIIVCFLCINIYLDAWCDRFRKTSSNGFIIQLFTWDKFKKIKWKLISSMNYYSIPCPLFFCVSFDLPVRILIYL